MASQKRSISFDESVLHEAEQRLSKSGGTYRHSSTPRCCMSFRLHAVMSS